MGYYYGSIIEWRARVLVDGIAVTILYLVLALGTAWGFGIWAVAKIWAHGAFWVAIIPATGGAVCLLCFLIFAGEAAWSTIEAIRE